MNELLRLVASAILFSLGHNLYAAGDEKSIKMPPGFWSSFSCLSPMPGIWRSAATGPRSASARVRAGILVKSPSDPGLEVDALDFDQAPGRSAGIFAALRGSGMTITRAIRC